MPAAPDHEDANQEAAVVGKFILGVISGGLLVTGGLVLGSALFPLQPQTADTDPASEGVTAPATVAGDAAEPEAVAAPEPASDPVLEAVADTPSETTTEAPASEAPAASLAAEVQPGTEVTLDPVDPAASALAPEALAETEAPVVAEVAQPAVPLVPPPLAQLDTDAVLAALDGAAAPPPAAESAAEAEVEGAEAEPAPEPALEAATEEPAPATEPALEAAREALPEAAPEAEPEAAPESLPEPEVAQMPEIEGGPVFEPAPGLAELSENGVVTGRLPRIGDAAPEVEVPAEADLTEVAPEEGAEDLPPVVAFAASFENPDAKPVLAIVLIDTGAADLDRAGLAALPFPVSFALDPLDPATPDRAAIYRAAGREVVMLATGLAAGANASDVEVSFQSMAQGLPEAVAVMDLANPAFQDSRPLASLVVPVVQAQGRGLLTWDLGLNAADQVARRQDVPAAVIFRDFATGGGDRAAVRRLLDRAVFKAGQEGRAVLAGEATADLVAALLEWTVEGKGATIALAPLTAVLTVE